MIKPTQQQETNLEIIGALVSVWIEYHIPQRFSKICLVVWLVE